MQIAQGIYDNGKITFDNEVSVKSAKVVVIFVEVETAINKLSASSTTTHNHYAEKSKQDNKIHAWDNAVVETETIKKPKALKAYGILNELANCTDVEGEKSSWERAVVDKYAKDSGA